MECNNETAGLDDRSDKGHAAGFERQDRRDSVLHGKGYEIRAQGPYSFLRSFFSVHFRRKLPQHLFHHLPLLLIQNGKRGHKARLEIVTPL